VCDWNPIDDAIVKRCVSTLKIFLNSAIYMGIETINIESKLSVNELLDRSTGTVIAEIEELIDNSKDDNSHLNSKFVLPEDIKNKINSSPPPKDSQLLLYKNDSDLVDISQNLIEFFQNIL
ncbi:1585_t:CDS:2, partial [Dentiscutata heterogama]